MLLAFQCRNMEASITNTYMTDYMKTYMDDPDIPEEIENKNLYPILSGIAFLIGPLLSNWSTFILI